MSLSAVAACMAPLILRPLVAGNCELENGFDSSVNGSLQLLKAAAAANNAQAIVITLLEEYGSIFEVSFIFFSLFLSFSFVISTFKAIRLLLCFLNPFANDHAFQ